MKIKAKGIDIEVGDSGPGLDAQGRPHPAALLIPHFQAANPNR